MTFTLIAQIGPIVHYYQCDKVQTYIFAKIAAFATCRSGKIIEIVDDIPVTRMVALYESTFTGNGVCTTVSYTWPKDVYSAMAKECYSAKRVVEVEAQKPDKPCNHCGRTASQPYSMGSSQSTKTTTTVSVTIPVLNRSNFLVYGKPETYLRQCTTHTLVEVMAQYESLPLL